MLSSLVRDLLWFHPSSTSAFCCGSIPCPGTFFSWFHHSSASFICCGFIPRMRPLFVVVPSLVCICYLFLLWFHPSHASVVCWVPSLVCVHSWFPLWRRWHPRSPPDMLPPDKSIIGAPKNAGIMSTVLLILPPLQKSYPPPAGSIGNAATNTKIICTVR